VRRRVVREPRPGRRHGWIAARLARLLGDAVEQHKLGFVLIEGGIILDRFPRTLRGPDVSFFSHTRMPDGPPEGFATTAPDLLIEVISPSNRVSAI
jgi:Uma2 family endonuclease